MICYTKENIAYLADFWKDDIINEIADKLFSDAKVLASNTVESIIDKNADKPSNIRFKNKNKGFHFSGKVYLKASSIGIKINTLPPLHPDLIAEFIPFRDQINSIDKDINEFKQKLSCLYANFYKAIKVDDLSNITPDCLYPYITVKLKRTQDNPYPDKKLIQDITDIVHQYTLYKALV